MGKQENPLNNELINIILNSLAYGIFIVNNENIITFINKNGMEILKISNNVVLNKNINNFISEGILLKILKSKNHILGEKIKINDIMVFINGSPIIYQNKVIGKIFVFSSTKNIEDTLNELQTIKNLNNELQAIFDASYDEIYVIDGKGITLRVNKACERLYGIKAEDLIGKSVDELEEQGIFNPSIAKLALKEKKRLSRLQTTKSGKKLIVTSNPVFDECGNIVKIVSTSKDVTEIFRLKEELEETKELVKHYSKKLSELKQEKHIFEGIVTKSPTMIKIFETIESISKVDSTVLLLGESGVGKTLIAQYIHKKSNRNKKPFVSINCGAIPESLIESELFGYEKGAFTGAKKEGKIGLIEMANNGTLFLDEISEIPYHIQVKFLQVIQEKKLIRVGGVKPIDVDFRLIAASNKDIENLVTKKKFREDLYYRLNVVPIHIPPLRERKEDIQVLIYHFLETLNNKFKKNLEIDPLAFEYLLNYSWPGNIRELENIMERLVVTTKGNIISLDELPPSIRKQVGIEKIESYEPEIIPLKQAVENVEKSLIVKAYKKYKNTYKMAEVLKVSQPTIIRKIKKYIKS